MTDISQMLNELTLYFQSAQPALDTARAVLHNGYALVQDLTPLFLLLLFLLLMRWDRRIKELTRRQEQQTRTLVKLLNLHPDSDHQKYLRVAEQRARERERRAAKSQAPFG